MTALTLLQTEPERKEHLDLRAYRIQKRREIEQGSRGYRQTIHVQRRSCGLEVNE